MRGLKPDCFRCRHSPRLGLRGWSCDAFDQIPVEVLSRQRLHTSPIDGDGGVLFETKESQADADYKSVSIDWMRCDGCQSYLDPSGCRRVEGEISPLGWCSGWTMRRNSPQVYVDLDGVLADFDAGYEILSGRRPSKDADADDVDWSLVETSPGFYAHLPPMSDARILWDFVESRDPIILTGVPRIDGAADDKRAWVRAELGPDARVITCLSREKYKYCQPGDILIDDWEKHRQAWIDAGGRWITHTSALDTIAQLRSMMANRADAQLSESRSPGELDTAPIPASGVMIVTEGGRVLMLRDAQTNQWSFPGGKIEEGEDAEQAALRECDEEIGRRPEIKSELTRRIRGGVDYTTFLSIVPEEFVPVLSDEHVEYRWLPVDDLASAALHDLGLGPTASST